MNKHLRKLLRDRRGEVLDYNLIEDIEDASVRDEDSEYRQHINTVVKPCLEHIEKKIRKRPGWDRHSRYQLPHPKK